MKETELVYCLRREDLETVMATPLPEGGFAGPDLAGILALPQTFLPRSVAEHDPRHKQLIPYQLFHCQDRFFVYQRGRGVGEGRLAGRYSLGIGGHINASDAGGESLTSDSYHAAIIRERNEELICAAVPARFAGFINDDSDPVGQVHLGAVHVCEMADRDGVMIRENGEDLHALGWWTAGEIKDQAGRFEKWSVLALNLLLSQRGNL